MRCFDHQSYSREGSWILRDEEFPEKYTYLGDGFKFQVLFIFTRILGEDSHFDKDF